MLEAAFSGYVLGLSLIIAIGAQNAFVLRQGLLRAHVFWVCLTCALSDAVLIVFGVLGFGWLAQAVPWLAPAMRWGGAAFLVVYGLMALRSAWTGAGALRAAHAEPGPIWPTLLTCLALTWLNPHVYLDTMVLLGSISSSWSPQEAWFGLGAVLASFSFFFALGYGARALAPVFERPRSWQVLDLAVGLTMLAIATKLVLG